MDKIEKVKIIEEHYDTTYCERCDSYFCSSCVDFYNVEFDIEENVLYERPDLEPRIVNFKGERVCQWCFNQLVDKFNSLNNKEEKKENENS